MSTQVWLCWTVKSPNRVAGCGDTLLDTGEPANNVTARFGAAPANKVTYLPAGATVSITVAQYQPFCTFTTVAANNDRLGYRKVLMPARTFVGIGGIGVSFQAVVTYDWTTGQMVISRTGGPHD